MPRKASITDLDNAVKLYLTGVNIIQSAKSFHTSYETLRDYLDSKGLLRTSVESRRIQAQKISATRITNNPISDDVIAMYNSGISENAIAKKLGVSRSVIKTRLIINNVKRRGQTESNRLRASQMSETEKKEVIKAAQESTRGVPLSMEHKIKIAKTREKIAKASKTEKLLCSWLDKANIINIPQKAIGPYNADIAINTIAVEVLGGYWHSTKFSHSKRSRYILDSGWNMLFIWVHHVRSPLTSSVVDYIISYLNEVSTNPSSISQYRVIRGDGQELSRGCSNDDNISIVVPGYQSFNRSS